MADIQEYILYNDIPYSQIKDVEEKEILDKFIDQMRKDGVEKEVIIHSTNRVFNIRRKVFDNGYISLVFECKFPDDLCKRIMASYARSGLQSNSQ